MRFKSSSKHYISPQKEAQVQLMSGKITASSVMSAATKLNGKPIVVIPPPSKDRK